jgi:hypothetical protein
MSLVVAAAEEEGYAGRAAVHRADALVGSSLGARRTASPLDDSPDGGSVKERLCPLLR